MHKFQQDYFFLKMSTKHFLKFTSERFVFRKTCPKTITLTFLPLINTAMFQNLLSKIIKNEILFTFSKAHSINSLIGMCYGKGDGKWKKNNNARTITFT